MKKKSQSPEYKIIGHSFTRGLTGNKVFGPIVASSKYIFLFVDKVGVSSAGRAAVNPLVGLIAAGIDAVGSIADSKKDELKKYDYANFPREIKEHPDWPLKKKKEGVVVIIPYESVDMVDANYFGTYDFHFGQNVINVTPKTFGRAKIFRFMEEKGWASKIPDNLRRSIFSQLQLPIAMLIGLIVSQCIWPFTEVPQREGRVIQAIAFGGLGMLAGLIIGGMIAFVLFLKRRAALKQAKHQTSNESPS